MKSEVFIKKNIIEHSASEHIEIPPCSEYTISSYAKFIQGYSVDYILFAKVQGQMGSRRMVKDEVCLNGLSGRLW